MHNFKIGDVVMLKSGSPKMTVVSVDGREVWCQWFVDEKPVNSVFEGGALELV